MHFGTRYALGWCFRGLSVVADHSACSGEVGGRARSRFELAPRGPPHPLRAAEVGEGIDAPKREGLPLVDAERKRVNVLYGRGYTLFGMHVPAQLLLPRVLGMCGHPRFYYVFFVPGSSPA